MAIRRLITSTSIIDAINELNPVSYLLLEKSEKEEMVGRYLTPREKYKLEFEDGETLIVWGCKEYKKAKYSLVEEEEINSLREYDKLHKFHFGVEYVDHPDFYLQLNKEQFEEEYESKLNTGINVSLNKPDIKQKVVSNFLLNLDYFENLDNKDFYNSLDHIINKYHFEQIFDLYSYKDSFDGCLYIMVLDNYKQFYIGKTNDLLRRIKAHWNAKMDPFRYFWDKSVTSRLSIDHFKILDTTRIYVCKDWKKVYDENINEIDDLYLKTNLFSNELSNLSKSIDTAERIVIMNSTVKYCLNDRTPLLRDYVYEEISKKYNVPFKDILIKHYIQFKEEQRQE